MSSHSLNSCKRGKADNTVHLQLLVHLSPRRGGPAGFQPVAANSVQKSTTDHGTRTKTHWSERSPKSRSLPQLSSKATSGTQGFKPRHHSNSENESLVGTKQGKMWAPITNNSTSFAEVSTGRRRGPRLRARRRRLQGASGRRLRAGGREGGIRRRQRPRREPSPRPSSASPAPTRALSPPAPSPPGRRALPEQASTPPWSQSLHNTDWRESAPAVCHSAKRPDFGKPPPPPPPC